jgi:hypothetical protein
MQRLQRLLVDRLHWHCVQTSTTIRFQHRFSSCADARMTLR